MLKDRWHNQLSDLCMIFKQYKLSFHSPLAVVADVQYVLWVEYIKLSLSFISSISMCVTLLHEAVRVYVLLVHCILEKEGGSFHVDKTHNCNMLISTKPNLWRHSIKETKL